MALQESLRVLAVLASPVCPLQEDVLRQPLLGRIMAFIRMQYRVRRLSLTARRKGSLHASSSLLQGLLFHGCSDGTWLCHVGFLSLRSLAQVRGLPYVSLLIQAVTGLHSPSASTARDTSLAQETCAHRRWLKAIYVFNTATEIKHAIRMPISEQDPEPGVRAAVVEVTVTIAANLEALSGQPAPGDAPSNPLLRDVFDGLTDVNPCVQHTAAACLVQVSPQSAVHCCPSLRGCMPCTGTASGS